MQERLDFEEFEQELWDYVSHKIVSRNYIRSFDEFSSGLSFDLYYLYLKGVEIKIISKAVEIFFSNLFTHRSSCENLPEEFHLDDF